MITIFNIFILLSNIKNMATDTYLGNDTGLVITGEVLTLLAAELNCEDVDENDVMSALRDRHIDVVLFPNFSGEAATLEIPGEDTEEQHFDFDDDVCVYIPVSRTPNLFCTSYPDPDELIEEVTKDIKQFLPDDFDLLPYICEIRGTYWC